MVRNLCTTYGQLPSELLLPVLCSFLLFFFSALSPTRFFVLPPIHSFSLLLSFLLSCQITCFASFPQLQSLLHFRASGFFRMSCRNIKENIEWISKEYRARDNDTYFENTQNSFKMQRHDFRIMFSHIRTYILKLIYKVEILEWTNYIFPISSVFQSLFLFLCSANLIYPFI